MKRTEFLRGLWAAPAALLAVPAEAKVTQHESSNTRKRMRHLREKYTGKEVVTTIDVDGMTRMFTYVNMEEAMEIAELLDHSFGAHRRL